MKFLILTLIIFFFNGLNAEEAIAKTTKKKGNTAKKPAPKVEALNKGSEESSTKNPLSANNKTNFGVGAALAVETIKLKDSDSSVGLGGFGLLGRGSYRLVAADKFLFIGGGGLHLWNITGKSVSNDIDLSANLRSNNIFLDGQAHYILGQGYLGLLLKYETMISGSLKLTLGDLSVSRDLTSFTVTSFGIGGGYAIDTQMVLGGYLLAGNGSFKVKPSSEGDDGSPSKFSSQEIAFTFDYFF